MNAWMGRDISTGGVTILITRLPVAIKEGLMQEPDGFFAPYLRYPMLVHLYLLRGLGQNHWNTLKDRMWPLYQEVSCIPHQWGLKL